MAKSVNKNLLNWRVAPGFEDRVKEAFGGASIANIAKTHGVNYHTLWNQVRERRAITVELLIGIANLTNYSIDWLLTAEGPKMRTERLIEEIEEKLSPEDKKYAEKLLSGLLHTLKEKS